MLLASQQRKPILCYVTDRRALSSGSWADSSTALGTVIEAAARAGVDWIQFREKDLTARALALLVRKSKHGIAKLSRSTPPRILVNDRMDVALTEGAGGVHLAENSLPVAEARGLLSASRTGSAPIADFLIGASTHSLAAATAAAEAGADYIIFGPIFQTPSKAEHGRPQGLAQLSNVCAAVLIPVLAIGGITLENAAACRQAGAAGVAAIRLFQKATNLEDVVQRLRDQLR
jgi:thiamine-phosphate pyrophosphorylase